MENTSSDGKLVWGQFIIVKFTQLNFEYRCLFTRVNYYSLSQAKNDFTHLPQRIFVTPVKAKETLNFLATNIHIFLTYL